MTEQERHAAALDSMSADADLYFERWPRDDKPPAYLIANEASDGQSITYAATVERQWTPTVEAANRWRSLATARAALAQIEAARPRSGRRMIWEEVTAPDGRKAHRDVTP